MVYPRDALVGYFGLSPTFMLGIWHGDEWMKRDLAQRFYGRRNVIVPSRVSILYH